MSTGPQQNQKQLLSFAPLHVELSALIRVFIDEIFEKISKEEDKKHLEPHLRQGYVSVSDRIYFKLSDL
jgi:hypothetical protein